MSTNFKVYRFADFELDEEEEKLFQNRKEIPLTETEYKILLLLIQRRGKAVSRNDFLDEIWGMNSTTGESSVSVHISRLRDKLCKEERERFIKSENNRRGYKFVAPVEIVKRNAPDAGVQSINAAPPENITLPPTAEEPISLPDDTSEGRSQSLSFGKRNTAAAVGAGIIALMLFAVGGHLRVCTTDCFAQTIFIAFASLCYGILVSIGLLLECAYRFDQYGWKVARMIPSVFLLNAGGMFAALATAGSFLPHRVESAFATGLILLIISAVASCTLAALVLPHAPVTAARFQTQASFAAFCKNVFIYFLPLYAVFGLLIFCLIYQSSAATSNTFLPVVLLIAWTLFFIFSYISTNYLSDNLLTEKDGEQFKYHGLFSLLLMLRMIFCFGTSLVSVIWYLIHTAKRF